MHASILLFALETNPNTVFTTFCSPCNTSVLSLIVSDDDGEVVKDSFQDTNKSACIKY
jgi:hypothetical protein